MHSTIETPSDIERKVNVWSRFLNQFGVATGVLSIIMIGVGWYAVAIYKPDQEAERADRRLNANSAAKVASAVENQTSLMATISHGLESLSVELREGQQLQRETHVLLKGQRRILEELVAEQKKTNAKLDRPIATKPMTDGGQE